VHFAKKIVQKDENIPVAMPTLQLILALHATSWAIVTGSLARMTCRNKGVRNQPPKQNKNRTKAKAKEKMFRNVACTLRPG
jgi:hypothetical protein